MSIEVKDLSFSYGYHQVLDEVSFSVQEGELLAVLGPNGVGKTTLFSCMLALQNPQHGMVLLDGKPLQGIPASELAQRIAYVPQSHSPTFNYSVFDMVLMGTTAQVGGFSAPGFNEMETVRHALERVDISHLASRGFLQISGGERQLALIARALAQQAKVMVMDEPTANLDYGNQLRILSRIKELTKEGYTIIQSTHNPDHALMFADRVLALNNGRVVAHGTPRECVTEKQIEELYGVRVRLRETEEGHILCDPIL